MSAINDLQSLKRRADEANAESQRAAGALEQVMLRLKNEYGCSTLDEAKVLLAKLGIDAEAAEEKFIDAKLAFEEKYKEVL